MLSVECGLGPMAGGRLHKVGVKEGFEFFVEGVVDRVRGLVYTYPLLLPLKEDYFGHLANRRVLFDISDRELWGSSTGLVWVD